MLLTPSVDRLIRDSMSFRYKRDRAANIDRFEHFEDFIFRTSLAFAHDCDSRRISHSKRVDLSRTSQDCAWRVRQVSSLRLFSWGLNLEALIKCFRADQWIVITRRGVDYSYFDFLGSNLKCQFIACTFLNC